MWHETPRRSTTTGIGLFGFLCFCFAFKFCCFSFFHVRRVHHASTSLQRQTMTKTKILFKGEFIFSHIFSRNITQKLLFAFEIIIFRFLFSKIIQFSQIYASFCKFFFFFFLHTFFTFNKFLF